MDIKNITLRKGMSNQRVNYLIRKFILFEDDKFMGSNYPHNWKCKKCGTIFKRRFGAIKQGKSLDCGCKEYLKTENRYRKSVEKTGEYEYIRSFRTGEMLPNGKVAKDPYIQVKHKYCGSIYEIKQYSFINRGDRCTNCCQTYENSFAHHIEVELGEPLDKYWDFEKNTVNPYHIWKHRNERSKSKIKCSFKVWIKCQSEEVNELNGLMKKDYHGSYEIGCNSFVKGGRCVYCSGKTSHPKDSFAQYHIDNTDKDFLEKYWDYKKNTIDPWKLKPGSRKRIWIKCQEKDYHESSFIRADIFIRTKSSGCSYCSVTKVHPLDSFGYCYPHLLKYWSNSNTESPFNIYKHSGKFVKFICAECGDEFDSTALRFIKNDRCRLCSSSTGETLVMKFLQKHNIKYTPQKSFSDLKTENGNAMRYDFYLDNLNTLIEYDGEFHYLPLLGDERLKNQKMRDSLKNKYAENNNINLIRIPYWEIERMDNILFDEISKLYNSIN